MLGFGSLNGVMVALPFILRQSGVAVPAIANTMAVVSLPTVLCFLWAPIVDIGFRRKTWVVLSAAWCTIFMVAAFLQPLPWSLRLFTWLCLTALIGGAVGGVASGALATGLPSKSRAHVGSWIQVGALGGGGLAAAVVIWLAERFSIGTVAIVIGILILLPRLAVFTIHEGSRPGWAAAPQEFRTLWRAVQGNAKSADVWMGALMLMSPIGTGTMTLLFSGIATDYHAGGKIVVLVTGLTGSLVTSAGALVCAFVVRRLGIRVAYCVLGIASSISGIAMMLAPLSPMSYAIGSLFYSAVAGACWAAGSVLMLELIGADNRAAGTWYAIWCCAGNLPVLYMSWLDGIGYQYFGPRGMLGVDAGMGLLSSAALLIYLFWSSRRPKLEPILEPQLA
jgi:PAT family beta-lactamase induction signal transducer AmpG